ncbi:MAG: LacI family DNA-binding transcriptional regulator [Flavobacteriaceae bacterium]|nr:LacI family DNA-binding transcriptional regulator [Flavobacteriaceae bacterium]
MSIPTKITIKHISKLSGFSISTVSKALNGGYDISKKTRFKIQELAASNNYIPNSAARTLRSKRTKTIAVIVPHINSTFYGNILSVIQKSAFDEGYKILVLQSFGIKKRESDCINEIKDGCVDGIILIKSSHERNALSSRKNGKYFISNIIYIEAKSPMNAYKSKLLGEKSLNMLLKQIN